MKERELALMVSTLENKDKKKLLQFLVEDLSREEVKEALQHSAYEVTDKRETL